MLKEKKGKTFWVNPPCGTIIFDPSIFQLSQRSQLSAEPLTVPTALLEETMVETRSFHIWTGVSWELSRRHLLPFCSPCIFPLLEVPSWPPSTSFDLFLTSGTTFFGVADISLLLRSRDIALVCCLWIGPWMQVIHLYLVVYSRRYSAYGVITHPWNCLGGGGSYFTLDIWFHWFLLIFIILIFFLAQYWIFWYFL